MGKDVFGIVGDADRAAGVVQALHARGIASKDISVLFASKAETEEFANRYDTARESAAMGASAGSVIGSGLGVLAGIGALVIPGLGIFIAAGPLMVLFGALAGAAIGGISGALKGLGLPTSHAEYYEERVKAGEVLMAVRAHTVRELRCARQVLQEWDAQEVFSMVEVDVWGEPQEPV